MTSLEDRLLALEKENETLRKETEQLKRTLLTQNNSNLPPRPSELTDTTTTTTKPHDDQHHDHHHDHTLTNEEISRYSRQLILPEFGINGQTSLKNGSVLVVGAGGLGAPVILYLAGAGVSKIGIVDHDDIEVSNLHRQIIHDEASAGTSKARSAARSAKRLNSQVDCIAYEEMLDSENAMRIFEGYDVIIDCTDNPATRYLINDACVLKGKPLVSGSALRVDGQLSVLNFNGGPCYRCLFPTPPPPEAVVRCGDGGVLGIVPGIIGCLQALEAIKVLIHIHHQRSQPTSSPPNTDIPTSPSSSSSSTSTSSPPPRLPSLQSGLLFFSAFHQPTFRSVRMRSRNPDCPACGHAPTITTLLPDYPAMCGGGPAGDGVSTLTLLSPNERSSVSDFAEMYNRDDDGSGKDRERVRSRETLVLDVRDPAQYEMCRLRGSVNVPLKQLAKRMEEIKSEARKVDEVFVLCRLGNDSQTAVRAMRTDGIDNARDVIGGLNGYSKHIDPTFPTY